MRTLLVNLQGVTQMAPSFFYLWGQAPKLSFQKTPYFGAWPQH